MFDFQRHNDTPIKCLKISVVIRKYFRCYAICTVTSGKETNGGGVVVVMVEVEISLCNDSCNLLQIACGKRNLRATCVCVC